MHSAPILDPEPADSAVEVATSKPNGVSKIEDFNDRHGVDGITLTPTADENLQVSPQARKRGSVDPSEQPSAKRVKKSPASTQNGDVESLEQGTSERVNLVGSIAKDTWQGFCEIQSEPAFFSTILKDMGVSDLKVQEVVSFRPEFLEMISRPSFGLILLYRYRDQSSTHQKEASSHVWFANQLPAQNSCATLAMINILMNNGNIEIGEHLQQFKNFTKDFNPYQRGEAFASFDFVKKIHNTFAKKMDILEADKHLSYKVKRLQRDLNDKKARRKSTDSAATNYNAVDCEESANHFIAFIPVNNEIWMLDGMNYHPMSIASFDATQGQDWVEVAASSILALLDEDIDNCTGFTIGPSPLPTLRKQACFAINQIRNTELRLDEVSPEWKSSIANEQTCPHPQMLGIEDHLSAHPTPNTLAATIASEEMQDLLDRRTRVLKDLEHVAASIIFETQSENNDARMAAQARFDHAPIIKLWAEMLAANGYLEQNLEKYIKGKEAKKGKK